MTKKELADRLYTLAGRTDEYAFDAAIDALLLYIDDANISARFESVRRRNRIRCADRRGAPGKQAAPPGTESADGPCLE